MVPHPPSELSLPKLSLAVQEAPIKLQREKELLANKKKEAEATTTTAGVNPKP